MTPDTAPSSRLVGVIRQAYGLDLGGHRRQDLLDCLRAVDTDVERAADTMLRASPAQLGKLVECTTNNETYFFRHGEQLTALKTLVSESLAKVPRPSLRVWVAGCSSGEEPLSIAAVLREAVLMAPGTTLSVLGTDLHRGMLQKAHSAQYTAWSFRGVLPEVKAAHFVAREGHFEPSSALRSLVTYRRHNLLEGPPESAQFDVVSCRNVLIYFDAKMMQRALELLSLAVAPGGFLLLGPAETPNVSLPDLEPVVRGGVSLFRRKTGMTLAPPPMVEAPARERPRMHSGSDLRARGSAARSKLDRVEWPTRVQRLPSQSPEHKVAEALVALEHDDSAKALEHLDEVIGDDADNAMAHYLVGSIWESRGENEAAEQSYQRALVALRDRDPALSVPCGGGITGEELVRVLAAVLETHRRRTAE